MFKKFLLAFFIVTIFTLACTKDDDKGNSPYELDRIEISSFKILNNSSTGMTTETSVLLESNQPIKISDHGVILQENGAFFDKIALGPLTDDRFQTTVNSGLVKGERYSIYPYIFAKNTFYYGDTLEFESNVDIDFEITEIVPLQGFINDTILIKGKNFCKSSETNKNLLKLGGASQRIIFESDSLIKAIILPNIPVSELSAVVTTCGVDTASENPFVISPPVLDSIYPHEAYVGESFFIHGQNFHPEISKVWLDDLEILLEDTQQLDKLEAKVTKDLPSGLLDLKIQVLDRIIERKDFYQSTTPVISELDKLATGFLDTLTIKGDYFLQRNEPLEVLIGNRPQRIIDSSKTELKIIIDNYFEEEDPKLVVKTGSFELTEDINMLPPQIISFDKEKYHLHNEEITIKTKYFLGFNNNVKIGEASSADFSYEFEKVDAHGNLTISLTRWLEAVYNRNPKFVFDGIGEMEISLTTAYGVAEENFKVFAPTIESLSDDVYYHASSIRLTGLDFGYNRVSKVYVDDVEIPDPGNSSYAISNTGVLFKVPGELIPGVHTVKVITGGQVSNEVQFELGNITASSVQPNSGTRKDVYTIAGTNLDKTYSYGFSVNGFSCTTYNATPNQVQIRLPYFVPLDATTEITFHYGDQVVVAGTINGIEPYEKFENYEHPANLDKHGASFEYNGKLYGIGYSGIYEFDTGSKTWSNYETNMPDINNYIFNYHHVSVVGDDIYVHYGNSFLVYNMQSKIWSELNLAIEESYYAHRAAVSGNYAYLFMKRPENSSNMMMYKYDLQNNSYTLANQPNLQDPLGALAATKLYEKDGKLYLDVLNDFIMVYDVATETWENIGFPKGNYPFHYDNNLYVYNGVLYFSGGRGNEPPEQFMYAYDLNTRVWTEKTPMLLKLTDHTLFGENGYLYISMGAAQYGYSNREMMRYSIATDPY